MKGNSYMSASANPRGEIMGRMGINPDANQNEEASSEPSFLNDSKNSDSSEGTEQGNAQSSTKDAPLTEDDLQLWEGQKTVPYNRFKEVNEKAKTLQEQLKELESKFSNDLRRAVEDTEFRVKAKVSQELEEKNLDQTLDPYERETRKLHDQLRLVQSKLTMMESKSEHQRLQGELDRLEKKYPKADALAVLGWAKNSPNVDLEELMERSHTRNVDYVEKEIRSILEQKKQKARSAIPTREGGIKIKESERPKTVKEANTLLKKFMANF